MSDTSEAEGEAPRVRILCAPPSTTSLHQPTPPFATLLIHAHNHPSPPRPARNPAAHQTGRHDQGADQRGHTRRKARGGPHKHHKSPKPRTQHTFTHPHTNPAPQPYSTKSFGHHVVTNTGPSPWVVAAQLHNTIHVALMIPLTPPQLKSLPHSKWQEVIWPRSQQSPVAALWDAIYKPATETNT